MTQHVALTTTDNPYDPLTQFNEWRQYDEDKGYATCGLLARITRTSDELSITDQELAVQHAIDEIINEDVMGIYVKVIYDGSTPKISATSGV